MILRTIYCGVCPNKMEEPTEGEGHIHWGQLKGINLNGDDNPYLCPQCLTDVANFTSELADENLNGKVEVAK